jgi:outer membrane protein OmpA-like peptidoglycan-associated protein
MGYEYVMDSRPNFDSQFYIDGGVGLRYPLQNNINIVSELKAMHMLKTNSDQDAEFAFYIGVGMPFGTIIRPRDADRDGIYDYADMCPNSPLGAPVGVDGCPIQQVTSYQDSDGDTVPDGKDVCPNTPVGVGVNEHGCPVRAAVQAQPFNSVEPTMLGKVVTAPAVLGEVVSTSPVVGEVISSEVVSEVIEEAPQSVKRERSADGDGDGVSDAKDQCKNTPKGFTVNAIGCALKKNLNVKFDPNSSTISTTSKINIREFAQFLKRYPNAQVSVVGYTDTSGNRESNKRLSTKRAQIVKNLLIKYGVAASKITAVGKGDLNPIATNDTPEGREKNRRIEVEIK